MGQTDKLETKQLKKRILALLMALFLIAGMVLGWAVQIRFAQLEYLGTVLEYAAGVTGRNTQYLSDSALERAWKILKHTVKKPESYEDYEMYASLAIARMKYAEAIPYMEQCAALCPAEQTDQRSVLQLRLGSLYALDDQPEQAILCFEEALSLRPDLADAYLLKAQMHNVLGEKEEVLKALRSYESYVVPDPSLQAMLGSIYENCAAYADAERCYSLALPLPQNDQGSLLLSRARCRMLQENYAGAKEDLYQYTEAVGDEAASEADVLFGICHMNSEEYSSAVESFHTAIEKGFGMERALYGQSVLCAFVSGDYDTAIADGEKALAMMSEEEIMPEDGEGLLLNQELMSAAELHQWIGLSYFGQSRFPEACEAFQKARATGNVPGTEYYLGLCYASQEQHEPAIASFSESIDKNDGMQSLSQYNRGICYLQTDQIEAGIMDLLQVLQRGDDKEASGAAESMLEELEDQGFGYYIGLSYAALEQYEQAISYFTEAIDKNDGMQSAGQYNRGICYLQTGQIEAGIRDLLQVLQRDDDAEASKAAADLIDELERGGVLTIGPSGKEEK